ISGPVNPAGAKHAVRRQGDLGKAKLAMLEKKARKLSERIRDDTFILRDGVSMEGGDPVRDLPVALAGAADAAQVESADGLENLLAGELLRVEVGGGNRATGGLLRIEVGGCLVDAQRGGVYADGTDTPAASDGEVVDDCRRCSWTDIGRSGAHRGLQ